MYKNTQFDRVSHQFFTHKGAVIKIEARTNAAAVAGFVQVHDSNVTPAEAAVPKASWPVSAAGGEIYKEFKQGELFFSEGLFVVFSTTEATLTTGTGNNKFAMVSAETFEADETVTVVGDKTTAVNSLQVWAEASGPKRLRRLQVTSSLGVSGTRWLKLYAKDTISVGDIPIVEWVLNVAGEVEFDFGKDGRDVFSQDSNGTRRVGCTLQKGNAAGAFAAAGTGTFTIRAEYV